MLGKFVEIDYEMEGLAAPPVAPGFVLPAWVSTSIVVNIIVLAESVAAAMFLPLDSWERMGWSLLHLIGGAMLVLAFQFRGTVLAIMDDTSVTAIDCIVWPPRAWEALAERLPQSSRHFVWATVGLMGILMSLLVIRSVPYSSPFAIDEAPAPKRKSVLAQAINQVKPKQANTNVSMQEALNDFAEEAGVKDVAEMKKELDQLVPEEDLQGKEKVVHTARCIIVGYFTSDSDVNILSRIVVATANRFSSSRSKFEILGTINVQGTPAAAALLQRLRGNERDTPFVESQLSAIWVDPTVRCEINFNELGANRQPVNLKLKQVVPALAQLGTVSAGAGELVLGLCPMGQQLRLVEHQIMSVVGSQNQYRFVPAAVLLNPLGHLLECKITTQYGSNRVVDIVGVIGPVHIAGFHHQPPLRGPRVEHFNGRERHLC
jgi:hypothetical protein